MNAGGKIFFYWVIACAYIVI